MEYSARVEKFLESHHVSIGDLVQIEKNGIFEGTIMPNTGDPDIIVVKLKTGYNIGLHFDGAKIKKLEKEERQKTAKHLKAEHDSGKKTIMILHTGGTIASKIDYETGAVKAAVTPEEIVSLVPELKTIANIRTEIVFQMASDDIGPEHWKILARRVADNVGRCDGFIITHGTDTMHYTSAALSFMLRGLQKPVLLVGSQRSSDRGSSDATMNLICAANFIANTDFAGVALCMHAGMDDEYCYVHPGLHVRKMHTSRRDAFKTIDVMPVARVSRSGHVEFIEYRKNDLIFKPVIEFDKKVALVKIYPGFDHRELEFYEKAGYSGVVLEGTGLGHAPISATDEHTKDHAELFETIKRMAKNCIVVMTSQCIFGKVNLNVYSPGRKLLDAGVLPAYMTPETAFVKLGWVLGHAKSMEEARHIFVQDVAGEIVERIDPRAFLE